MSRHETKQTHVLYYKERYQGEISEDTTTTMGCYRIITTARGLCNDLFYDQIIRLGNIHNWLYKTKYKQSSDWL